jgi:hypothetical protein
VIWKFTFIDLNRESVERRFRRQRKNMMARSRAKDYDDKRQIILHRSALRGIGIRRDIDEHGRGRLPGLEGAAASKNQLSRDFGADRFSTFATVSAKPDVAGLSTIDRRGMD